MLGSFQKRNKNRESVRGMTVRDLRQRGEHRGASLPKYIGSESSPDHFLLGIGSREARVGRSKRPKRRDGLLGRLVK